jgi:nicotinamidase/pyrazinamidase
MKTGNKALLVVDVQNDFCPGGALPAAEALQILPALNQHVAEAREQEIKVYASRDWHPEVTNHFKAYGGPWPPHCVQGSEGARFHPDLELPADAVVITKGDVSDRPGYSAFDGRTPQGKSLLEELRDRKIDRVCVAGLTAEYCVKQTVLDALKAGFDVTVLADAVAGINAAAGDADRALAEMADAGARVVRDAERVPQNIPS